MSGISGFVGGVIGLSLFEAVLSSGQASGRVGGVFTGASALLRHIVSPDVPAIPDLRPTAATTASAYLTAQGQTGQGPQAALSLGNRFPTTGTPA